MQWKVYGVGLACWEIFSFLIHKTVVPGEAFLSLVLTQAVVFSQRPEAFFFSLTASAVLIPLNHTPPTTDLLLS